MSHWRRLSAARFGAFRRIPVTLQENSNDCGAACLAMVFHYFGSHVPMEDLRRLTISCERGSSGLDLAAAAADQGFTVQPFFGNDVDLQRLPKPAIMHCNHSHFVVLERWTRHWAEVVDPAVGRRRLKHETFRRHFSGVAIVLRPKPGRTATSAVPTCFSHAISLLTGGERQRAVRMVALSILARSAWIPGAILAGMAIDRGSGLLGAALALLPAICVLGISAHRQEARFKEFLAASAGYGFVSKSLAVPYRSMNERSLYGIWRAIDRYLCFGEGVADRLRIMAPNAVLILVSLGLFLWRAPRLAVLLVAGLLAYGVGLAVWGRRAADAAVTEKTAGQTGRSLIRYALNDLAALQAAGLETRVAQEWLRVYQRDRTSAALATGAVLAWEAASRQLDIGLTVGIVFLSAWQRQVGAGTTAALAVIGLIAVAAIREFSLQLLHLGEGARLFDEASEVLAAAVRPKRSADPDTWSGEVELRAVSFAYMRRSAAVIRRVSLRIDAGDWIAIEGPADAGKTTLARLIAGLEHPVSGEVLWGRDAAGPPRCAYVPATPVFLPMHLRALFVLRAPAITDREIEDLLLQFGVYEPVRRLGGGLGTSLGPAGEPLSVVERVRVALALAMAARPLLLVVDGALDKFGPSDARETLEMIASLNCTRIVLARHLPDDLDQTRIFRLAQGELVAGKENPTVCEA